MHASTTCPSCGAALPDSGGARQCPACLLKTGMDAETMPCDAEDYADGIGDADAAPIAAPREAIGTMIGRYRLLQEIGEGGFGIVYRAEQSEPVKRKVALKVLKPGMDTREVVSRFEAERQALAVMDHPNIAQVYDGGATDSGRPYFVMELVKGVPVTRYCDDNQLLTRQRLELFLDVLLAVQHAHQKGVIHRDLKPSNILVSLHDGKPVIKVIDFGIAIAVGPEIAPRTVETGFGQMIGTPQYMSPEQAELNARDVDTRSDIYSLGIVLYELLTGRTPLDAHRIRGTGCLGIQRLIREQEPAKPSARYAALEEGERKVIARRRHGDPARLAAMLRGDLDRVVMKALEKVRARRYQTANALAMDIRRFLDDEPVSASPPSTVYRFAKFARRHKFGVAWTAVISVVILTAAVGMTLLYFKAEKERLAAQRRSWEARMAQATALRWSGRPERRFQAFEALREAAANAAAMELTEDKNRMRDAAIACLAIVDMRPVDSWQGNPGYGSLVSANRTLTEYACTSPDGRISILSYPGRSPLVDLPGEGNPVNYVLKFSPDGKRLAAAYGQNSPCQLKLWTRGGAPVPVAAGSVSWKAFGFFPDGLHCAVGRMEAGQPVIAVIDVKSGIRVRQFPLSAEPHSLSVSRNGQRIAVSLREVPGDKNQPGHVVILDAATGELTGKAAAPQPRSLAWSPVENSLAVCSGHSLRVWHDEEWTAEPLELPGHTDTLDAVSWSPEGRVLASQSWDGMVRLWDPAQGTALSWHPGRGSSLEFSADGSRLGPLIEGAQVTVLEVASGDVCYRGRGHAGGVREGIWNKAGALPEAGLLMATSGNDGVRFWNREGRHLGRLPLPDSRGLAFSADSLFIGCREGLFRCRITATPGPEGITVVFAPREKLHSLDTCEQLALSTDDNLLALAAHQPGPDGGKTAMWLVDLKSSGEPRWLEAPAQVANCALSEDGRWLAAGTWKGNGVRLWQLPEAGAPVDLPVRGSAKVAFSPDGRWLATGDTESYRFWKYGTWELKGTVPSQMGESQGAIAFTPRKTAIAIARRRAELKILHPVTFQEMSSPDFDHEAPLCFDREGRIMVTFGPAGGLFFWKLETLRAQLSAMDLDWDELDAFEPKSYPALRGVAVASGAD